MKPSFVFSSSQPGMMSKKHIYIILIFFLSFLLNSDAQHMSQSGSQYQGNIYHLGGNVGIGVSNPSFPLHISTNGSNIFRFHSYHINSAPILSLNTMSTGLNMYASTGSIDGVVNFALGVNSDPKAIFIEDGTGHVGIGITSPSSRLHLMPERNVSATLSLEINPASADESQYNDILFLDPALTNTRRNWVIRGIGHNNPDYPGLLEIWSPEAAGKVSFMGSGGNIKVGIGTSSPSSSLHIVQQQNATSGELKLEIHPSSTTARYTDINFIDPSLGGSKRNWVIRTIGHAHSQEQGHLQFLSPEAPGKVVFFGNGGMKVAIGTTNFSGNHSLYVNGSIIATEVVVKLYANWPDFVFAPGYKLPPLRELEEYIRTNKHLPGIPDAGTLKESGLATGDLLTKQMQKIEELTLYVIELNKELDRVKQESEKLKGMLPAGTK